MPPPSEATLITASLLEEAKRIELRTRRRVDNQLLGRYRAAFRGTGLTFADLREYEPGDDIKHIHWKVTARSGRVYVKSYEEERQLTVMLVVDTSASTHAGAGDGRFYRELEFCALIGMLAHRAQDQIGVCVFSRDIEEYIPPASHPAQLRRVLGALLKTPRKERKTDIEQVLFSLRKHLVRPALVFLVSDFYAAPFDDALSILAERHDVVCTYLEDPLDSSIPAAGIVEFEDAETGERYLIDTSSTRGRKELLALHEARLDALSQLCRRNHAEFLRIRDRPFAPLCAFMRQRGKRLQTR